MFYGSSDILEGVEQTLLPSGQPAERLSLRGGPVLVLSERALALYRNPDAIDDPLGNGLIQLQPLDDDQHLVHQDGHFVSEFKAGYIGLTDNRVILITPAAVQLFPGRDDALRNQNQIARLSFE